MYLGTWGRGEEKNEKEGQGKREEEVEQIATRMGLKIIQRIEASTKEDDTIWGTL